MKDKKLIILWVLVPLAVISLIYGVLAPGKRSGKKASPAPALESAASGVPAAVLAERRPQRGGHAVWERNPFVPPQVSLPGLPEKGLILHGILWEKTAPRAVINEKIVKAGDRIQGYQVVKIEKDRVTLTDGTTAFELRLGRRK